MSGPQTTDPAAVKDQAVAWLARLNSGRCSEEERRAFRAWLDADDTHRWEYHQAWNYWHGLDAMRSGLSSELHEARSYRPSGHRHRLAIAASLLILIVAAAMLWPWPPDPLPATIYQTAKGEQKSVVLADGSRVDLNTDTQLRVTFTETERSVQLENGEAFFNIARDEQRPFEVIAGEGRIRDIGTAFCVQRDSERVSLVVSEGLVQVETDTFASPLSLSAGHALSYDGTGRLLDSRTVDVQAHIAWRNGRIVFQGASLDDLARQIMRYHNVTILVDRPGLEGLQVSGSFRIDDLNGLLSALSSMLPVEVTRPDANSIRLSAKESA